MLDIIGIIDKIIEEHKVLLTQAAQLEIITNDAGAMMAMNKSTEVFMPGQVRPIPKLKEI